MNTNFFVRDSRYFKHIYIDNLYIGEDPVPIDGDEPQHITWIHEKANERAAQFNISGVTYRLTQVILYRNSLLVSCTL